MCKWSDPFSKSVLIDRGLDHNSLETLKSQRKNVSSDYSVLKARPSKKYWTKYNKHVILVQSDRSVSMTVRFHLFPFRTQKLSSLVPKIVRWKRRVKIGSRRLKQKPSRIFLGGFLVPEIKENILKNDVETMILLPVGCVFLTTQVQLSQRMDRRLHRWQQYMSWIRVASGGFWPSCGGSAG